jgi:hypothetical protein
MLLVEGLGLIIILFYLYINSIDFLLIIQEF